MPIATAKSTCTTYATAVATPATLANPPVQPVRGLLQLQERW